MKPTIHFMEQGHKNEQVVFANDEEEFAQIVKTKGKSAEEDASLGKRKTLLDEEDAEDLEDVKTRATETNKRYRKFAEMLEKKEKLDEYYLRIDREKRLLVPADDPANEQEEAEEVEVELPRPRHFGHVAKKDGKNI